jgi:TrmH family RNA methyltransferase
MSSRLPFRSVTSRHNPIVSRFRRAARRESTAELVLVEGLTLVEEAARAGWPIEALAVASDQVEPDVQRRELERIEVDGDRFVVSRTVLEALSPASSPSGVVALARFPAQNASPFVPVPALVVIASDVQDPGNVGAMSRAAEAAGATGLLVCGISADPFGWKALRGSMGSAFRLPIMRYHDTSEAIRLARDRDLQVLVLTMSGETTIHDVDMRHGTAMVVGGEGAGLRPDVLAAADVRLRIPMKPPVESLNVAVAAGIVLYEAMRQRAR